MIMMAAVVTPVLLGSLDNARVKASHDSLIAVRDAILAFEDDDLGMGGKSGRRGEAGRAGTDDKNRFAHRAAFRGM